MLFRSMWLRADNGKEINADEALRLAQKCDVGGYSDWRLPTIAELKAIHDPSAVHHVVNGIELQYCTVWSGDRPRSGICHAFNFCTGIVQTDDRAYRSINRALLVRDAR